MLNAKVTDKKLLKSYTKIWEQFKSQQFSGYEI